MLLIKNFLSIFFPKLFIGILVSVTLIANNAYSQTTTKKGGIAFRTDDDQPISQYLEYAALLNSYNKKFTFAINLGKDEITSDYLNGIRQMQASGHEMMDHTPWHDTHWFQTFLSTDLYVNHPGVYRVLGARIDLKHADVDINDAKRTGYLNTSRDTLISPSGIFSSFSKSDCYLYFPSIDKLVFIDDKTGWIDQYTVKVTDFWGDSIDLGSNQNIQFYNFDYFNVHLTIDALKALAEESLRLANYYNLQRPYTWIQPGGYWPQVHRNEVKQACGDALGYKSAGVFADPSLKVFNEYNPDNDKQFGMNFGDFKDNVWTAKDCKGLIADRIAKHHVVFGENHFDYGAVLLGGWSGFLARTDSLLQWCTANNIPVRTYSEWADILYNQTPNPNENIIPPLNVDLDVNNLPDGYNLGEEGTLDKTRGYPSTSAYSYWIKKVGNICSITNLGGIEKGQNQFEIATRGSSGDYIEVIFKVGTQNLVYKFPAQTSGWTVYNLTQSTNGNTSLLNIPTDISLIDITIRCSNYSSGTVRISGMKLYKSSSSNYLNVNPTYKNVTSLSGSTTFDIYSNISWAISDDADWLTVSPANGLNNGTITVNYTANTTASQRAGIITITGGGITRTVTFTQATANRLDVTPSNQSVANTAGITTFTLTSNVNWTASNNADWLSLSVTSGSNDETITATYLMNETISQRVGTITIIGGGITRTVTVTQAEGTMPLDCPAYMISYWKLDETAGNIFTDNYNGYNGLSGTSAPAPTAGIVNGAQSFNGTNTEINIASTPEFNFGVGSSFTIEFWTKHPGSILGNEVIIGRDDAGSHLQWWVGIDETGKAAFHLESKTGEGFSTTGTSTLINSNWRHVVAVRDANLNELRLYVDGALEGTSSATYNSGFDSLTSNINIGWLNITGGYHFAGSIDELAIYNDALSIIEIQNHYYAGLSGFGYCDPKNFLAVKLFLEGPYLSTGDSMSTILKTNHLVPLTSPYSQNQRTVSAIPQNVVDWVLVELRSSVSGPAVLSKSVFLHKSGNLVADEGITQNILLSVSPGNYYIVIRHRNYLAIISSSPLRFERELLTPWDFTTGNGQYYGTGGAKELEPGVWGMIAGDASGDGQVNAADRNETWNFRNQVGYLMQDVTLDTQVNAADRNITWNNRNLISLVP